MKTLTTKLIGAALLLGASTSLAIANTFSVTNIPAGGSLTLRAWPSTISRPLSNIPFDATKIEATGKTILLDTVNWLQIAYGDNTGWVEASYLKKTTPQAQAQAQAPQVSIQADTSGQERNSAVINKAEFFSYGETKTPTTKPTPTATPTTLDPNADIIANNIKYPWNIAADSIYNDPKTKTHPRPIQTTIADAERLEAQNSVATTTTTVETQPQTNTTPVTPPIAQTQTVAAATPVATPTVTQPTPVIMDQTEQSNDYRFEYISGNRYEHIETAATAGFMPN